MLYSAGQWTLKFLVASAVLQTIGAWRNFDIIFHNVTCEVHLTKMQRIDCNIRTSSPSKRSTLNVRFVLAEDIVLGDLWARVDLLNGERVVSLVDYHMNGCDFLAGESPNKMLQLAMGKMHEPNVSNLPTKCPLQKNKEYFVKDFYIDAEKFPPYTPQLKFNSLIDFRTQSDLLLLHYALSGEMRPKSK